MPALAGGYDEGMDKANDPLRFVSYLFEIAVWPFQAAAKHQAQRQPLSDQHQTPVLLLPAMLLFIPLCLLISCIAVLYVFFVVLPIEFFGQILPQIAPQLIRPVLLFAVGLAAVVVAWSVLNGLMTIGMPELVSAGAVIVILAGHQLPRIVRKIYQDSRD